MPYYNVSDKDRDMIIRTVMGEANDEPAIGQAAVAHVIMNRVNRGYANTPTGVVLSPHQFEPWQTRTRTLQGYNPNSGRYQKVAAVVDGVLSGQIPDPTGGATHFLAPKIVAGRVNAGKMTWPDWAPRGQGLRIGGHDFYAPGDRDAIPAAIASNAPQSAKDAISATLNAKPPAGDVNAPLAFADTAAEGLRTPNGTPVVQAAYKPGETPAPNAPASPYADEWKALQEDINPAAHAQPTQQGPYADEWKTIQQDLDRQPEPEVKQAATAQPTGPIPYKENETAGEFLNRKISENQGPSVSEHAARYAFDALKGVKDISNTLAQGVTWLGSKGAHAIEGMEFGKYKGEPVHPFAGVSAPVDEWRKRIDDRINKENADFDKAASLTDQVARLTGTVAGSWIPGAPEVAATETIIRAAPMIERAAPILGKLIGGATRGGTSALASASTSDEPVGTQVLKGAVGGAGAVGASGLARAVETGLQHSWAARLLTGGVLYGIGQGEYKDNPDQFYKDVWHYGLAALTGLAGAHAGKLMPIITHSMGPSTGPRPFAEATAAPFVNTLSSLTQ